MRMLFAATVPVTLDLFMRGQLAWIAGRGHEVHVVSSPGPELREIGRREGVHVHPLPMEREISLEADAKAIRRWAGLLRTVRPDIAVVGTPKAGLLGTVAASGARVPRCVYLMRGARFEGESGIKGATLRLTERIACSLADTVIAVSPSLAAMAIAERVVGSDKLTVVGSGSSNGVDTVRFRPPNEVERAAERSRWGFDSDNVAMAFVGRLSADKGLDVLRRALERIEPTAVGRVVLMLAGPNEGVGIAGRTIGTVQVRRLGTVDDVPSLLRACDLLVLPTQREGFPNVVLEAAACGLPVVTTDATGAIDSVIDGVTGLIVPKRDGRAMARALTALIEDPALRRSMGGAARRRVEQEFANELVWRGMLNAYLGTSPTAAPDRSGRRRTTP